MSNLQSTMLAVLGIIAIVLLSLVYSLAIMFEDSYLMPTIRIIQIFTLLEFALEIFVRFTVKRYELG
jgi:anaerobic C4-dicarboxylate transporter